MMRKYLAMVLAAAIGAALIGCGASGNAPAAPASEEAQADAAAEAQEDEAAKTQAEDAGAAAEAAADTEPAEAEAEAAEDTGDESKGTSYASDDGWSVRYDPETIACEQIDEHTTQFVYLGESAGTNMLVISWEPDIQPEELLYEVTSNWGDQEAITRSEGFFPGTEDKWGYWRILPTAEGGSGLTETAIAGEYNGGTLMFDITSHFGEDEGQNMAVSDTLAEVMNSITYEDGFEDQEMYSYYPGTYTSDSEDGHTEVVLNDDHTGVLRFQDDIDILWGSIELIASDGSFRYEYTIEGDNLMVKVDDEWLEFAREK